MQLDQTPFFRKTITPWYDSSFACRVLTWAMVAVFFFAVGGIYLAGGDPRFSKHLWFPSMLAGLSGFLVIKIYFRLRARAEHD